LQIVRVVDTPQATHIRYRRPPLIWSTSTRPPKVLVLCVIDGAVAGTVGDDQALPHGSDDVRWCRS
jgi:hypothetical protein